MAIDGTTNATWARSWLDKVEYVLSDYPLITPATITGHIAMCLPSTSSQRRPDVIALIRADESWPGLVAEVAVRVGGFDLDEALEALV